MKKLTSWSFADKTRQRVNVNRTQDKSYYGPGHIDTSEDKGTTHLSVLSPDGAAVAVTSTINFKYACCMFLSHLR